MIGGCILSFYVGAVIGSIAIAIGETLADEVAYSGSGIYDYRLVETVAWQCGMTRPEFLVYSEFRPMPGRGVDWVTRTRSIMQTA